MATKKINKSGDIADINNYRAIDLSNAVSKVYIPPLVRCYTCMFSIKGLR